MRARPSVVFALGALASIVLASPPGVAAEGPAGPATSDARAADAAARYDEGLHLLQDNQPAAALAAFDASLAILPSPNTQLVRAHALRLLKRRAEAMSAYEDVVRAAGEKVRAGEERFRPTIADAGRWVALLRAELGELDVEVVGAPPDAVLSVDGVVVTAARAPGSATLRARVWHEPGATQVVARASDGREVRGSRVVAAGGTGEVHLGFVSASPTPARAFPAEGGGPPAASWVVWGIGAAGFVTAAVFGGIAASEASSLDRCKPNCSPGDSDAGSRNAAIANVGFVVGPIGAVSGAVLWLALRRRAPASTSAATLRLEPSRRAGSSLVVHF